MRVLNRVLDSPCAGLAGSLCVAAGLLVGGDELMAADVPEEDQVVQLDVGGYRFATFSAHLAKCAPGTPLRELLSRPPAAFGHYFIDRDGRHFHHVLNYLRDGLMPEPVDPEVSRELFSEACHYGLVDLQLVLQDSFQGAPPPSNEEARLSKLESLGIMHTDDREARYDCITGAVKSLFHMPIVLISLVGDDHQWFKSRCGLGATQTSRNSSFCAWSFLPEDPEVFIVENAITDVRTRNNPLVLGEPKIGFYAGCPLVTSDGIRLGALCVIDHVPRKLEQWQLQALTNFGLLAVQEIQRGELERAGTPEGIWREAGEPARAEVVDASLRRKAWRVVGTGQDASTSYGSGLNRLTRMKEALKEIVCLVQVNGSCMVWPVLYANETWTRYTGMRVYPPSGAVALDTPLGQHEGDDDQPNLWDFLSLGAGMAPKSFLQQVRVGWEARMEPHVFALEADLITLSAESAPGRRKSRKESLRPVSCRLVPVHEPLDLNAEAVKPGSGQPSVLPRGCVPECYLYFMQMVFSDRPSRESSSGSKVLGPSLGLLHPRPPGSP